MNNEMQGIYKASMHDINSLFILFAFREERACKADRWFK